VDLRERGTTYREIERLMGEAGFRVGATSAARHLKSCGKPPDRSNTSGSDSNVLVAMAVSKVLGTNWPNLITQVCAELEYDPAAEAAIATLMEPCPDYIRSSWRREVESRAELLREAKALLYCLRRLLPAHPAFAAELASALRGIEAGSDLAAAVEQVSSASPVSDPVPMARATENVPVPTQVIERTVSYEPRSPEPQGISPTDVEEGGLGNRELTPALLDSPPFDYEREVARIQSIGDATERAAALNDLTWRRRGERQPYVITNRRGQGT
jgi:hypothetical protein